MLTECKDYNAIQHSSMGEGLCAVDSRFKHRRKTRGHMVLACCCYVLQINPCVIQVLFLYSLCPLSLSSPLPLPLSFFISPLASFSPPLFVCPHFQTLPPSVSSPPSLSFPVTLQPSIHRSLSSPSSSSLPPSLAPYLPPSLSHWGTHVPRRPLPSWPLPYAKQVTGETTAYTSQRLLTGCHSPSSSSSLLLPPSAVCLSVISIPSGGWGRVQTSELSSRSR